MFTIQKLRESTRASLAPVVGLALGLVLLKIGFVESRLDAFKYPTVTSSWYAAGLLLIITSLGFAAAFARRKAILGGGVILIVILQMTLNRFDPASVAFFLRKDRYEEQVEKAGGPAPKFIVFDLWSGEAFPAGGSWEYIIFDSTDQIGLPESQRTADWEQLHGSFVGPSSSECMTTIRHLQGHFFYLKEGCF